MVARTLALLALLPGLLVTCVSLDEEQQQQQQQLKDEEEAISSNWLTVYTDKLETWKKNPGLSEHSCFAVSGMGSGSLCVQPLISFLGTLLRDLRWRANVSSLLEASAGHWPSGWQAQVGWPPLHYTGIDILPEMVEENRNFSRQRGLRSIGLKSMSFEVMDMTREALPVADVLLTKDTLIHFTNEKIMRFLSLSVLVCPRRYRYVIFVHNQIAPETERAHENNRDFSYSHSRHPFQTLDMSKAPFNLATKSVFAYLPGTATADGLKVVELFEPIEC
ncbi:unnamed protein product [Polarella glacialis]|uniref:Methyltransferase domain-containing protein n=1 Tax=Polarella glacialis TaxID=89957 RepID=A0A813IVW7_POLGL|nr:unnamed protein product [Polarella glacialis]